MVTREKLKNCVWPADTFVEFDQGLYSAIRRLRDSLCDSAETPQYIETLARRGYRFMAAVEASSPLPETSRATPSERIRWRLQLADDSASDSKGAPASLSSTASPQPRLRTWLRSPVSWIAPGLLVIAGLLLWRALLQKKSPAIPRTVVFHRLTDFVGMEEFPAFSPDGKTVAFTADTGPHRQIWVRLIAEGTPLQITRDELDHLYPRWSQDSASIVYYSPPAAGQAQGTLWEISALGGTPRRLTSALSGADFSHDGKKLVFFRLSENQQVQLVVSSRDTSDARVAAELPPLFEFGYPRWSPDDRSIAYQRASLLWNDEIFVVAASGGRPRQVTHEGLLLGGFCWLPDGSGVIYSSARGSTIFYLPTMHLWSTDLKGSGPRQLTYDETSLQSPDADRNGRIVASRLRIEFDIWKYPITKAPADNVRDAVRITRQTGQVQTPTAGPGDQQLAYLSDEGGHANVWAMNLANGETRQITSERDQQVVVGVPVWSPDGENIVLISLPANWDTGSLWLVSPDGSNPRRIVERAGGWATWSSDSRWLYYTLQNADVFQILKIEAAGGVPQVVRTDNGWASALAPDASALYYVVPLLNVNGSADYEVRVARPENGASRPLARISGDRVPHWQALQGVISHDGKWLALPLSEGTHTDLWLMRTDDGKLRQVTDFGRRGTFIARRVSWSSDDQHLFAAVGEGDADIIEVEGVLP